jgi:hypothetical protein
VDRFWSKVEKTDGCWNWTGCKHSSKGYGSFRSGNRMQRAHRVSYEMHCGPIPADMLVLHRCDNPGCVNPDHLFVGTNADNMADKVAKGRQAHFCPGRGEAAPNARLTENQVFAIRAASEPIREIAEKFGMSRRHIEDIRNRKSWAHI